MRVTRLLPRVGPYRLLVQSLLVVGLLLALAGESRAQSPSVQLSVQSRQIYAEVPFVLQVTASGFEESPEPVVSELVIPGARVSFLGMSPSVMSRRSVINGRVSSSREVRFVYSYRVETERAGSFEIPELEVTQDGVSARSRPGRFNASDVANSEDMRIDMKVPERPVWIGESFEVDIDWFLRLDPRDQTFVIPIFEHPAFEIEEPQTEIEERLSFQAGDKELQLPYQSSNLVEGGVEYTRFQFKAIATPTVAGRFELQAPRVVAKLKVGSGRDDFGFRSSRYELFKATGKTSSFEVKPLPLSGRPASFANAVGTGFSIQVSTSRSVVSVGEPIELTVVLGAKRGLEGLGLPPMVGEGRLDERLFEVIGDVATGQMSEDGTTKTFKVTVVLNSAEAREIPPIEFAYFDPEDGSYKTTESAPIALNVDGANVVGAQDVVGHSRDAQNTPAKSSRSAAGAFAGDLTPSSGSRTLRTMTSLGAIAPLLYGLYGVPLLLLAFMLYLRRTGESRGRSSALRKALAEVEAVAKRAAKEPAESSGSALIKSVRDLGRMTGDKPGSWTSEVEKVAFDPDRRGKALDAALIEKALSEARGFASSGTRGGEKRTGKAAAIAILLCLGAHDEAHAEPLDEARAAYAVALNTSDRGQRTQRFEEAERLYRALAKETPDRPELLADWGNAALGAGELGTAVLAYRRALALDRGLLRAEKNLQWVRGQMPERFVASGDASAVDSLFFWHRSWSLARRHTVAAFAFALTILLLVPWGLRFQGLMRRLAILPLLLFVATLGSALLEPGATRAAVIVRDGQTLYSADSLGAPPALGSPIAAGLEVELQERRGSWSQVELADGTVGWLSSSAVERVE